MDNKTAELLEKLAAKFGTTSEYLWGVLLKQAPVDATITLIQIVLVVLTGIVLFKLNKYFSNDENKISYYQYEEALGIPMFIGGLIWVVLVIASFFSINDVINGFINPEFWALNYILESVK